MEKVSILAGILSLVILKNGANFNGIRIGWLELLVSFLDLIDEITDHVDTTERRLIKENQHVKKVTRKAGSTGE